jgi:hypothetical protein
MRNASWCGLRCGSGYVNGTRGAPPAGSAARATFEGTAEREPSLIYSAHPNTNPSKSQVSWSRVLVASRGRVIAVAIFRCNWTWTRIDLATKLEGGGIDTYTYTVAPMSRPTREITSFSQSISISMLGTSLRGCVTFEFTPCICDRIVAGKRRPRGVLKLGIKYLMASDAYATTAPGRAACKWACGRERTRSGRPGGTGAISVCLIPARPQRSHHYTNAGVSLEGRRVASGYPQSA